LISWYGTKGFVKKRNNNLGSSLGSGTAELSREGKSQESSGDDMRAVRSPLIGKKSAGERGKKG